MAPALPRLHLVTNDQLLAHPRFLPTARVLLALEGPEGEGVALHLRGPRTSPRELLRLGRAILSGTPSGLLLVNDRVDVARALALEAPGRVGIHLPERALPPSTVRAPALGPGWHGPLGRSAHLGGAEGGPKPHERRYLHYLFLGTLYATPSHPGRPGAGPEALARWLGEAAPAPPVVAIGGITPERVAPVLEAGAWGVAVLRGAWDGVTAPGGGDPVAAAEARARAFLAALAEARASRKAHAPQPEEGEQAVELMINGEPRTVPEGTTVAGLLERLELLPALVVVERNREIVPRDAVEDVVLAPGDELELVHFVGGG